jgi:hypothetical protein
MALPRGRSSAPGSLLEHGDKWQLIGETFISAVSQTHPGVGSLTWTPSTNLPDYFCILLLVDTDSDPIRINTDEMSGAFILKDRHAAAQLFTLHQRP